MPRKFLVPCLFLLCAAVIATICWPRRSAKGPNEDLAASSNAETAQPAEPPEDPATPVAAKTKVEQFAAWTQRFLNTSPADRTADLMTTGAELVRHRRAELAELIQKDPKAALEAAIPMTARQKLPQAIVDQLEERVSGKGFYGVLIGTDFEKETSEVRREVVVNNQTYRAFVYGRRRVQVTQEHVPLWGIAVPDPGDPEGPKLFAISEDPVRPIERGETFAQLDSRPCPVSTLPSDAHGTEAFAELAGHVEQFCMASHIYMLNDRLAADISLGGTSGAGSASPTAADAWSQGPKTLLYMRVTFPDDPVEPITEDEAYARMDEVNQWFIENSYNTTELIPTVTPLLMLPYPKSFYSVQGTSRLLSDSRQAAREQAALDTDNFHWDIVRHPSVPGFSYGGLAFVRGKGTWLQSSGTGVTAHELGHNYGLWHANYWTASGDSVIGPGSHQEYGNNFDTMGAASAGANHFNAAFKNQLDWLPETFVHTATTNGTYRIYTFDAASIITGQKYAIKVRKDYDRNYWAEFRQRFPANRWFGNGVHLNWDPWDNGVSDSAGGTHLLDTTPGTPDGKNDCPVIVGRTFSDAPAGVHITPIGRSNSGENWIDVVVNMGAFSDNAPPVASLIVDRTSAAIGGVINLNVIAWDPEGDDLAYAWDFGDALLGPNAPSVSKSWGTAGEYTVRCTVSDMKGGVYSQKTTITIGSATTFRIGGRVTTPDGAPLEGVRVHNGLTGSAYRGTYTDSEGNYVLANNLTGSHTISAVKYGYTTDREGWANPVSVGPSATGRDFMATPMPLITIAAADPQATEASAGTGRFVITRTGPTNVALVVRMNRSGTATLSTDYTLNPNPTGSPLQLTIPVGAASLPITVTPVNDTSSEGAELVMLTLQDDTTYALGSLAEAALTIVDDEAPTIPTVDISASSPSLQSDNLATESGSDSGVFTFTRTGNVSGELMVSYSVSGSATAGVDYEAFSGVISIPAGQTLATLPFRVIDDIEVESNETVIVSIVASPAYNIIGGSDNTSITIVDDDLTTVFVTASDDTARESNASGGAFVISRVGRLDVNLLVSYAIEGTATPADYTTIALLATIPAGRAAVSIPVTAINDGLMEGEETVVLRLASRPSYNVGNPGTATINIVDDDAANVQLSASDATAAETGDTGAFTFTRTGGSLAGPLEVHFQINGTATPGADFISFPDSIIIPAGAPNFVLTITPIDDTINEASERVTLTLLPLPDYTVPTPTPQSVTITSNDGGLPGIGFTLAQSSGLESVTGPILSVTLSSVSASAVTVNYAVTGGGATGGGVDYTLANGILTFLPSTNNQPVRITVVNDTILETNETIFVTLSSPGNAVLDANATHIYTIIDDDRSGNVTITALDATASEAGDPGVFRIARSGSVLSNLTVGFQILGSASSPTDYESIPDFVTIPSGTSFVDLTITPVNDFTDETNETVTINLLSAPGGRIASPDLASITILDDDDSTTLPTVSIAASDPLASEPGADTGTFTITRSGDTTYDLTVTFSVGGTALAADYGAVGTTATIPAGVTETNIIITAVDDGTFETNETVTATLTLLPAYRVGASASATVIIEDNEVGVSIIADGASSEDGLSTGSFLITRTGSTASDLSINFSVAGTATRTTDYASFSNSVVIPAGTNSVSIPVNAVNDAIAEGGETVVTTLIVGGGYVVRAPSSATLLILDDEPVVTIVAVDSTAHEAGGDGLFTIARSGSSAEPLTVDFVISGAASNGIDYVALPAQVVLSAGQSSTNLAVVVIDDSEVEGPEVVSIALSAGPAYSLGSPSSAVVTINDNEVNLPPTVNIVNPRSDVVFIALNSLSLVLEGRIADDGRPSPGTVTSLWTRVSGPGTVTFGNTTASNTFVRFPANGVYVLRLTANDGQLESTDELTVVVNASGPLATGLQAYWRFDETNGVTAADSSGNGRTGTLNGPTWTRAGRFNSALDFDGVNDVVNFTSPAAPQVSFSAWVYTTGDGASTTPRVIATPAYNVRIRRDANSGHSIALEAERTTTADEWRSPLNSHTDNTWHHIVVAYDSVSGAAPTMYIDGQPQTVTARVAGSGTQVSSSGPGFIGNSGGLSRPLLGRIDETRMYNRILTAGEALVLSMGPPTNIAAVPNAGPDRSASGGATVILSGSVTDDGQPNPPAALSNLWTKFSGPGEVGFANPRAPSTTATFSAPGIYVLALNSDDGQATVFDQMTVTIVPPATVTIAASGSAAEFGPLPASFTISRDSGTNVPLTVFFSRGGSAQNGVDYADIQSQVTIQIGAFTAPVAINPILDALAEGDESVILTLNSNVSYIVNPDPISSLTIHDRPYDDWRFAHFTASQLGDPLISGDSADYDGDGIKNLLEYGLNLNPTISNALSGFTGAIEIVAPAGRTFVVTHTRRKSPRDINYLVEVSSDLSAWSSGASVIQELDVQDDGNGITETVRVRILSDMTAPGQRFSRLRVTKQSGTF